MPARRQISLFVHEGARAPWEALRSTLDPVQHRLIPAHVTLCRDDEPYPDARDTLAARLAGTPALRLVFGPPEPFNGHGLRLPCVDGQSAFHALRARLLGEGNTRRAHAHLTLAHPRNPRASGNRLGAWAHVPSRTVLVFDAVQAIVQTEPDAPWKVQSAIQLQPLPLAQLPNLGPRSQAMLAEAGLHTWSDLAQLGAVVAYARVRSTQPRASLNLLWALEGALTGLRWQDVAREHRTSLLLALESVEQQRG